MALYNWRKIREGQVPFPEVLKSGFGWYQTLAREEFEDVKGVHAFGHNDGVGATNEMVWHQGGQYEYLSSASTLAVASSSVNDVNVSGSGAWNLCLHGLDANFNPQKEVVALNGQTGVNTAKQYIRVFRKHILQAGATGWNEGSVRSGTGSVVGGVPQTIVTSNIGINFNETLLAMYTVHNGYTGYLTGWSATSSVSKQVQIQLRIRRPGEPFAVQDFMSQTVGQVSDSRELHLVLPSRTDIEIQANAVGGGGDVGAKFNLYMERDE